MELRGYKPCDLEAMVALDEACFAREFLFDLRSMRQFAEAGRETSAIAVEDGAIAGFVIAEMGRRRGRRCGYCVTLDVAAAYRRQGLGGRLLAEAERLCREHGAAWMGLHVYTGNAGAIDFYERQGYVGQGVRMGFYGAAGLDAFEYGKVL